jgi:hypothetical protein
VGAILKDAEELLRNSRIHSNQKQEVAPLDLWHKVDERRPIRWDFVNYHG